MKGLRANQIRIAIPRTLLDRLSATARREGTTASRIAIDTLEARARRPLPADAGRPLPSSGILPCAFQFCFPSHIEAKLTEWDCVPAGWRNGLRGWQWKIQEYIGPLSVDESFDVPDLMLAIGFTLKRLPSQQDRIRVARVIRAYVESLPGIFPGPVDPKRPFLRQYYFLEDAALAAYEDSADAAVEDCREEFEQCKDD